MAKINKALTLLDQQRKKAIYNLEKARVDRKELGLDKPSLSIQDQYLAAEIGTIRDNWLKSRGWIRTQVSNTDVLVSYRNETTKYRIWVWKDHSVTEFIPKKIGIKHPSWKDFVNSQKSD